MPEDERVTTAYHEAGHAVVAYTLPKADPVHKVTKTPNEHLSYRMSNCRQVEFSQPAS